MHPASAIPIGTAKLRITIDSSSCSVPIAAAARVPRSIHSTVSAGIIPGSPQSFPQIAKRMNTQIWVNTVTRKITASFPRNTSRTGTGAVISTFQLLFRCSSRHR